MPQKRSKGISDSVGVQNRTLTYWINDKLAHYEHKVKDLAKDLDDGVILIELLQTLTGKIVPERYSGKPTKSTHRQQNLAAAFSFMSDVEKLPILDIGPSHLTKHSLKDILSLVWSLVSRYSIAQSQNNDSRSLLLDWINAVLPDQTITDFTTCWSNGVNLLELVNFCRPGLVPDLSLIDPASALENIKLAMKLALDNFSIPQVMAPEDLAVERPDERSVMTYLSYFCGAKSAAHKLLFLWLKQHMPSGIEITNLGKDWVNGRALGALINSLSSGGFPEFEQFDSNQSVENCDAALDAGEKLLGVDKTLTAQEFANPQLNILHRTSYFIQLYHSTRKVTVESVHRPSECGPGEMMSVDLSFAGGNLSMIKSSASGLNVGPLDTVNEMLEEGKFRVSFETQLPDNYSLFLTVGGLRVSGSPFTVNLSPPDVLAVQHLNTVLPKKVGIPVIFLFDISHAGHGELQAEAVGSASGPTPVTIDTSNPASQIISFIPMQSEVFTVTVRYNNEPVIGSPFSLPLDSLLHPEKIAFGQPLVNGLGEPVQITLDTHMAGHGELLATCQGDKSGQVDVTISRTEDKTELSFTPPTEDIYYLSVTFDGTEVLGSPLKIDLYPKPPDAKCVELSMPPSGALTAGSPITIGFNTAQAGQGEMTATCFGKLCGEVPIDVSQTEKYEYQLRFTPPDEDVYSIHVLWSEKPVKGSPFKLDLISEDHPRPNNCSILDSPLPSDLLLTDEKLALHINTSNSGRGKLAAIVKRLTVATKPVNSDQDSQIESKEVLEDPQTNLSQEEEVETVAQVSKSSAEDPSVYSVSYTPIVAGQYSMSLLWAGEHIPGSPLTFTVTAPQEALVGSPIVVNLKTVYKRKHLKAYAIPRGGGPQLKVKMEKVASGDYKLIFQPKEPGVYLMHVSTKDKPISGSPFIIRYMDVSNPAAIKISGLSDAGVVGQPMEFIIDAKDAGFGDITVAPFGSTLSIDSALTRDVDVRSIYLKDNKDGTYSAVFTPDEAGDANLDIRFGGVEVPGSPFPVTVLKREDDLASTPTNTLDKKRDKKTKKSKNSASLISGLNLEDEKFMVGSSHKFKIHCDDLGEGELEVSTKPHSAAEVEVTHDSQENSYWVEILPKKPGKNDILVKFNGSHILGSPFRVQFLSRGDADKCMMIDTPKEFQQELDNQVSFCISTKGAGKGKITAEVKSLSTKNKIPSEVLRVSKHRYNIIFSPSEGLNYLMSVRYDEVHINGSPYKIALGDASLCKVEGEGLQLAWCGRWNTFRINVEDAGPGELNVGIERDDPDEEIEGMKTEHNISNIDENQYEVSYQPFFPGKYWITIKWGSINIPGSPFDVSCVQPLKPNQFSVDPVSLTYQGKPAQLIVSCDSAIEEADKMAISVHSQQEHKIAGQVIKNQDNCSYTCTISPPELDKYFVYILWDEKHISGSPFEITNVLPPRIDEFTVDAVDSGDGVIAVGVSGPPYSFRYGVLTAQVSNQTDELPVNVHKVSDEQCTVDFKPLQGGQYMLSVHYDQEHIVGSPFQLMSTDASQCYIGGTGLLRARVNEWSKFSVFTENGGPGELQVEVTDKEGEVLNSLITAASDTRYDVSYCPSEIGPYKISVLWDIQHIPGSPFNVFCCDPSRYTIPKLPKEASLGKPIRVGIKERSQAPNYEQLNVYASTKDHVKYSGKVEMGADGGYICSVAPPDVGKYMIHIQCNGFEISDSPFKLKNYPPPEPEKVLAEGPGLSNGTVGERGSFVVNVSEAGHGYLSFKVQGPKNGFKIELQRDMEDGGKIYAHYNPTHAGRYVVGLLWAGEHILNSPYSINIAEAPREELPSMTQFQEPQLESE